MYAKKKFQWTKQYLYEYKTNKKSLYPLNITVKDIYIESLAIKRTKFLLVKKSSQQNYWKKGLFCEYQNILQKSEWIDWLNHIA